MIRFGFNDPCRGNGADESINSHRTQPRKKTTKNREGRWKTSQPPCLIFELMKESTVNNTKENMNPTLRCTQ